MFALGLGVFAAVYGPLTRSRWLAPTISILCAGLVYLLSKSPRLDFVLTLLGTTLLVALLVLIVEAFRRNPIWRVPESPRSRQSASCCWRGSRLAVCPFRSTA